MMDVTMEPSGNISDGRKTKLKTRLTILIIFFLTGLLTEIQRARTLHAQPQTNQEVIVEEVQAEGLTAKLYLPDKVSKHPALIALGGSDGGIRWQEYIGEVFALQGYAVLALAYFRMEGLPEELDEIPLEYFSTATKWLQDHPSVDSRRLGVVGVSKGAELALLLASHHRQFRAVIAYVPSSVVWQSIAPSKGWAETSSWTLHGKPLAFVPYHYAGKYLETKLLVDLYDESLEQKEAVQKAAIEVENIRGAILLLSGKEDRIWPSTRMCGMVIARLRQFKFPYPFEHRPYENAGHSISQVGNKHAVKNGGTPEGNDFAQTDAQEKVIDFLDQHLKK